MVQLARLSILMLFAVCLDAKGTDAGTNIDNSAKISYELSGTEYSLQSNVDEFKVDKVVDIKIVSQDTEPVEVDAGETHRVLTFVVTNDGNSEDNITLDYTHESSDFVPNNAVIYEDTNGDGVFGDGDLVVTDLELAEDESRTLFIVSDIPSDADRSEESNDSIVATSTSPATAGADNQHEIDIVVRQGQDKDSGIYQVRNYWLEIVKSQVIHEENNNTHTGTIITYSIDVYIGGDSDGFTIEDIVFADEIPAGTQYVDGTLRLDGVEVGTYADDNITVDVPNITGDTHKVITFDVQVQ